MTKDKAIAMIEELRSALYDLATGKPADKEWMLENAQTALVRTNRFLCEWQGTTKFECRTCGERSTLDAPDCPRGAVHCDIIETT